MVAWAQRWLGVADFEKCDQADDNVLIHCDCTSNANVIAAQVEAGSSTTTGATGTVNFSSDGMDCSAGGSVAFDNFIGYESLVYEGQIVLRVETKYVAQYDDQAGVVTGSEGVDNQVNSYIWSARDSANNNQGRAYASTAEIINAKLHDLDTAIGPDFTSAGKGSFCDVCFWWNTSEWGILVDRAPIIDAQPRQTLGDSDQFYKLIFGAAYLGTNNPFQGKIKSIVVTRNAPRLKKPQSLKSLLIFGDSFAANSFTDYVGRRRDSTLQNNLLRHLAKRGLTTRIINGGHSGFTVCDTGSSDLSTVWDADLATDPHVVLFIAGNNDYIQNSSNFATYAEDPTTGTLQRYKDFITAAAAKDSVRKVIIAYPGSPIGRSDFLPYWPAQRDTVKGWIDTLPAWADANITTKPSGFVGIFDLHGALGGDKEANRNYQLALDNIGNASTAGAPSTDFHPSGFGHAVLATAVVDKLLSV